MSGLWEKLKSAWPHLAWLIAAIIVMLDVDKIYEWLHQHEVWGGVMASIFTIILAWANRRKSSTVIDALREHERQEQKKGDSR